MLDETSGRKCGPECTCTAPARVPVSVQLSSPTASLAHSQDGLAGERSGDGTLSHTVEQVKVPAGVFRMGDSTGDRNRADGEVPVHEVALNAFAIDATSVTNADFQRFVDATGYVTDAERFGYSAVFHLALAAPHGDVMGPASGTPWWLGVRGADWAHPGGRDSGIDQLGDHSVVHVSWMMHRRIATGPVGGSLPRRNGSARPGADWRARNTPGVMTRWMPAAGVRTSGKVSSPRSTPATTAG